MHTPTTYVCIMNGLEVGCSNHHVLHLLSPPLSVTNSSRSYLRPSSILRFTYDTPAVRRYSTYITRAYAVSAPTYRLPTNESVRPCSSRTSSRPFAVASPRFFNISLPIQYGYRRCECEYCITCIVSIRIGNFKDEK